jgi:type II secretory pathway component PulK
MYAGSTATIIIHGNSMQYKATHTERGNVLFMILLAIALIGALTAAVMHSNRPEGANIDKETLVIRASEVQRTAAEFERGILFMVQQNGVTESQVRFANPQANTDYGDFNADSDKSDQIGRAHV